MLIYTILFLFALPLLNFVFNNKNKSSIRYLSLFYFIFSLITFVSIGLIDLPFIVTMPLYITLFVVLFNVIPLLLLIYKLIRDKDFKYKLKDNLKMALYKYLPIFVSLFSFTIIIIFMNTFFPDTLAYLSVSQNYIDGLPLSFNDGRPLEEYYKLTPQITVYASLFSNNVTASYYILSPIVINFIYTNVFVEYSLREQKYIDYKSVPYWLILLASLAIGICSSFISSFMNSGNIFSQTLILLVPFFILLLNKENKYEALITLFIFQFYSPTGFINGLLMSLVIFVFICITSNIKNILYSLVYIPLLFLLPLFLFSQPFNNFRLLAFIICLIFISIIIIWIYLKRIKIDEWTNKLNNIIDKKWFTYTISSLSTIIGILVPVVFMALYEKNFLYTNQLAIITLISFISFSIFAIILKVKLNKNYTFTIYFILASIMSMLFLAFSIITKKDNYSTWRIIYLNIGMGGPVDIVLLFYLIIMNSFSLFKINKEKINKINIVSKIVLLITSLGIASGFIGYNYSDKAIKQFEFTNNVNYNINKVTLNDKKIINEINKKNNIVFSDAQIDYLLNICTNDSSAFFDDFNFNNENTHYISNWTISAYSIIGAITVYNANLDNINTRIFNRLLDMINSNEINTIILRKNTKYFNFVYNSFKERKFNIISGQEIVVIKNA